MMRQIIKEESNFQTGINVQLWDKQHKVRSGYKWMVEVERSGRTLRDALGFFMEKEEAEAYFDECVNKYING